jgi:chromate transporter
VQFSQSGYKYVPSASVLVAGTKASSSLSKNGAIFTTGLLAGVTTFGGAFTAVPYVLRSFVQINGFMRVEQFLDGIAIVNFVPTPLVMFVTWDGFIANGVVGGILMTLGMFLPCFTFVLVLHNAFMFLCKNERFNSFLEGVSAGVIGFIAESSCQLARAAIHTGMDTLIFSCTLMVLTTSTNKYAPLGIICAAALAGQVLYANGLNSNKAFALQSHESADIAALNATIGELRAALALQSG